MAIWQDLVSRYGFAERYASVRRYVRHVRGGLAPKPHGIIQAAPGEEAQLDCGEGPMVRNPTTGMYRRTRLFVKTLGYSRKSVRDFVLALGDGTNRRRWVQLLEELTDATLDGTRNAVITNLNPVPLLIIDDLGMRKLPATTAEVLLEVIMRRYERASAILTSNRPLEHWGKLLGATAAVTALLDRLLHHAHVITCSPRSWRTILHPTRDTPGGTLRSPSRRPSAVVAGCAVSISGRI